MASIWLHRREEYQGLLRRTHKCELHYLPELRLSENGKGCTLIGIFSIPQYFSLPLNFNSFDIPSFRFRASASLKWKRIWVIPHTLSVKTSRPKVRYLWETNPISLLYNSNRRICFSGWRVMCGLSHSILPAITLGVWYFFSVEAHIKYNFQVVAFCKGCPLIRASIWNEHQRNVEFQTVWIVLSLI